MATKPIAKKSASAAGRGRSVALPEIPDKLYYRIGEVARLCGVETYVLRFWETEFPQLKPGKSGTGQRLYRRREVDLARRIRHLLYEEGYTIPGARQAFLQEMRRPAESHAPTPENGSPAQENRAALRASEESQAADPRMGRLRSELKEILGLLSTAPGRRTRLDMRPERRRGAGSAHSNGELFD